MKRRGGKRGVTMSGKDWGTNLGEKVKKNTYKSMLVGKQKQE